MLFCFGRGIRGVAYYARLAGDLWRILGVQMLVFWLGIAMACGAWMSRDVIAGFLGLGAA